MFMYLQILKYAFPFVESYPRPVQLCQQLITVCFKVSISNEIQDCTDSLQTSSSAAPISVPKKTFSMFLCSFPVHCVIMEIPFLKCHRVGWWDIAWKQASISPCSPSTLCIANLEAWSLNMPLCSWCNMLGVKQEKISQCGKSFQNGLISLILWSLNSLGARPCDCCARIWIVVSGSQRTE